MQKETSLVSDSMALAAGEGSQRVSGELRPRPEEAGMNYEDLTSDMQDKVRACKSTEELMALAEEEGYELSDEELQQVSGGWGPDPGASVNAVVLVGCCCFTHRRVIKALIKHEPMPKAPKWHCWVKEENRRS